MEQNVGSSRSDTGESLLATVPNSPEPLSNIEIQPANTNDVGLIGELQPLNRDAKDAFHVLACRRNVEFYKYHYNFMRVDSIEGSKKVGCFVFSLANLPEFAAVGWRIGRGRTNLRNLGVDILLVVEGESSGEVAGIHARFAWVKGGGGFFLIADNMRGKTVTLNGELLSNEQRLIPYRNTIGIGECYFTLKFPTRTAEQDEQFQTELTAFYKYVLSDSVPMVAPTPSEHEVTMGGDWIVRNAIAKGTFGHVYTVTHRRTGKAAAAKELWRTSSNSRKVDEEVSMARYLIKIKHKRLATPFDVRHEPVQNNLEKARIIMLLDDTWKPGSNDVVDKYIFFSPLSTSTFQSLITSKASVEVRTILFTQVLEGIAFLHELGITHRDIKPANLLVQSYDPPVAQVTDFGSATDRKTILYDWPGTIPYLAPEQRERQLNGCQVDYWACAIVGMQTLGVQKSNNQIDKKDYDRIHRWLDEKSSLPLAVCCKAMFQWEPDDRMTAKHAIQHTLSQYQEKEPTNKRALE